MENAALDLSLPAPYYLYSITFYKQGLDSMEEACSFFFFLNSTTITITVVIFGRADYVPAASV